jgi:hypothetical protein
MAIDLSYVPVRLDEYSKWYYYRTILFSPFPQGYDLGFVRTVHYIYIYVNNTSRYTSSRDYHYSMHNALRSL